MQLGVQNKYCSKVLINNYYEEQVLGEEKLKDFLSKKEKGLLNNGRHQALVNSLQSVGLSYSKDGYVHFGDHIMVYSIATEGVLSVDQFDTPPAVPFGYDVTTSTLTQGHVARNTFVLEPASPDQKEGDVLKYGAPFRLRVNPALSADPYYLYSLPLSASASSRVSRKQLVCFNRLPTSNTSESFTGSASLQKFAGPKINYESVFLAYYSDIQERFEQEQQPVKANLPLVVVHATTRQPLASTKSSTLFNDYGKEFEVCCSTFVKTSNRHVLAQELEGKTTANITQRQELQENFFAFLTATNQNAQGSDWQVKTQSGSTLSGETERLQKPQHKLVDVDEVLLKIRSAFFPSSSFSNNASISSTQPLISSLQPLVAFTSLFVSKDIPNGQSGRIPANVFLSNLTSLNKSDPSKSKDAVLSESELMALLHAYRTPAQSSSSEEGSSVNYLDFLKDMRGSLSQRRQKLLDQIWQEKLLPLSLSSSSSISSSFVPLISVNNFLSCLDCSSLPEIKQGKILLLSLIQLMRTQFQLYQFTSIDGKEAVVTKANYQDYFANLSTLIRDDDFFVFIVSSLFQFKSK